MPAFAASACGSDGDEPGAEAGPGLRVERFEGPKGRELIVFVARAADNVPATARGADRVRLRCLDRAGRPVVVDSHPWPFTDTDGGLLEAHVHQRVSRAQARRVSRCELAGTRSAMRGRVPGPAR